MDAGWKMRSSYAFLTERARSRAPQIIDYAAMPGGAFLVAPSGEIVLAGGAAIDADVERIARAAIARGAPGERLSFTHERYCVHAVPVRAGWMLCVLSRADIAPAVVVDRATKAAHVLGLALADGMTGGSSGGGRPGGAPAEARVVVSRSRKS